MTIRLVDNAGSLSEDDLKLLTGTPIVEQMMRNRIMMVVDKTNFDWTDLTNSMSGLYHIRELTRSRLYQVWFEHVHDLDQFKKNLYMLKLSVDKKDNV